MGFAHCIRVLRTITLEHLHAAFVKVEQCVWLMLCTELDTYHTLRKTLAAFTISTVIVVIVVLGKRSVWEASVWGRCFPSCLSRHICRMRSASVKAPASRFLRFVSTRCNTSTGESASSAGSFPGSPRCGQRGLPGTFSPALCWEKQTAEKNTPSLPSRFTQLCPHLSAPHLLGGSRSPASFRRPAENPRDLVSSPSPTP